MSAVTKAIGLAKKLKHRYQDEIRARTPVYLSPCAASSASSAAESLRDDL